MSDEDETERIIRQAANMAGKYVCRVRFGVFTKRVCTKPKGHKGGHAGPKLSK